MVVMAVYSVFRGVYGVRIRGRDKRKSKLSNRLLVDCLGASKRRRKGL